MIEKMLPIPLYDNFMDELEDSLEYKPKKSLPITSAQYQYGLKKGRKTARASQDECIHPELIADGNSSGCWIACNECGKAFQPEKGYRLLRRGNTYSLV